jgi:hypothetical protein
VFEKTAPVDEEEAADDHKAGDKGQKRFPVRLAVK